MAETVVHVTTLEQWKSVLDVWFKQGFSWWRSGTAHNEKCFRKGARYLLLDQDNDILTASNLDRKIIEYSEFIAQQKEDKEVKTYYVTQEQLDLIIFLKHKKAPLDWLIMDYDNAYRALRVDITNEKSNAILRYLGGDETIDFNVKEQLYRLWAIDEYGDKVYFSKQHNLWEIPTTSVAAEILKLPLEEIKKWQTPAWEIEKAD